jgi:hypothetical protein
VECGVEVVARADSVCVVEVVVNVDSFLVVVVHEAEGVETIIHEIDSIIIISIDLTMNSVVVVVLVVVHQKCPVYSMSISCNHDRSIEIIITAVVVVVVMVTKDEWRFHAETIDMIHQSTIIIVLQVASPVQTMVQRHYSIFQARSRIYRAIAALMHCLHFSLFKWKIQASLSDDVVLIIFTIANVFLQEDRLQLLVTQINQWIHIKSINMPIMPV